MEVERKTRGRPREPDNRVFEFGDNISRILELVLNNNHEEIISKLGEIMSAQSDFNDKVTAMQEDLATIGTSIATARQEIADYIAANPALDTSALDSVVSGLDTVAASIDGIFVPTPPAAEPPNPEEPTEPAP